MRPGGNIMCKALVGMEDLSSNHCSNIWKQQAWPVLYRSQPVHRCSMKHLACFVCIECQGVDGYESVWISWYQRCRCQTVFGTCFYAHECAIAVVFKDMIMRGEQNTIQTCIVVSLPWWQEGPRKKKKKQFHKIRLLPLALRNQSIFA